MRGSSVKGFAIEDLCRVFTLARARWPSASSTSCSSKSMPRAVLSSCAALPKCMLAALRSLCVRPCANPAQGLVIRLTEGWGGFSPLATNCGMTYPAWCQCVMQRWCYDPGCARCFEDLHGTSLCSLRMRGHVGGMGSSRTAAPAPCAKRRARRKSGSAGRPAPRSPRRTPPPPCWCPRAGSSGAPGACPVAPIAMNRCAHC